jgi:hypothetical protein
MSDSALGLFEDTPVRMGVILIAYTESVPESASADAAITLLCQFEKIWVRVIKFAILVRHFL